MTELDFSRWRPHPWHGLDLGGRAPLVNAYIEITPFDMIKYEIDKVSGYLRVDRPQRTSSATRRRCTGSSRKPTAARASPSSRRVANVATAIRSTSAS